MRTKRRIWRSSSTSRAVGADFGHRGSAARTPDRCASGRRVWSRCACVVTPAVRLHYPGNLRNRAARPSRSQRPPEVQAVRATGVSSGTDGRLSERKRERESRAAVQIVGRPDLASMRVDDRPADRESESDAGSRRFARAARELLEDQLFLTARYSRAVVAHGNSQIIARNLGRDAHRGPVRRVLAGVLEQVVQHALDQRRVELDQRQVGWNDDFHAMPRERRLRRLEGAADHFFEREPLPVELHLAALDPRHFEQIVDQALMRRASSAMACADSELRPGKRRLGHRQRFGQSDQRGERGTKVVRQRGQQRVAQSLGFHVDERLLGDFDVVDALERNRRERREGVELPLLFGHEQHAATLRLDREHAPRAHRRPQRQVLEFAAGQRVGAETRRVGYCRRPIARWRRPRPADGCDRHGAADGPGRRGPGSPPGRETCGQWIRSQCRRPPRSAAGSTGRGRIRRGRASVPRDRSRRAPGSAIPRSSAR